MPYISAFYANLIFIIYIELTLNKNILEADCYEAIVFSFL